MIQISNEEVTIFARLRENQNCILLQFKASYSDQISEVFEKGFEGFRQRLNQEIFLPKNKTLFILTDENGRMYNQSETVEEALQMENNQCLVYQNLKSEIGERDNIRLRINNIRQAILGLEEQVQLIQFNPNTEKTFQVSIQHKQELGNVQFQFMCSGNEQTIQQLKQKALNRFSQNFPNIELLVEYDYFTIKNDNREFGTQENNELVSYLFQMESVIQLQLCLRGPIDANLLQNQFGNLFYKLVVMGQDIQYVFQQFYQFIEERGQQINEDQLLAIEDKILETSIEECQLLDLIKQQKNDFIRQYARSAINFAKKLSKFKMGINTAPHVCRGLRILTIFRSNVELNYAIASSISFSRIALSKTGFIVGGLAIAAEIGYLVYHRDKFTNKMFYMRIGAAVGKQVAAIAAYSGGMLAVGAGMPTLMSIILGLIFGVGLAFITLLCFEKVLNCFWGSDQNIVKDVNFLNDHDKNKCYFSSLQAIGCEEITPTHEIKKLRLKKLKELHPDKHNDQNKKDEFIKQYIAFEIVLSFREDQSKV